MPFSFNYSRQQGAHPGGTAAIGRVVDADLETEVDNLFVCDASVFPETPGLPPIVTIIALAKRLAKKLAGAPRREGTLGKMKFSPIAEPTPPKQPLRLRRPEALRKKTR